MTPTFEQLVRQREYFLTDPGVFRPGTRNNDGVNYLIICWCLGYDPEDAIKTLIDSHQDEWGIPQIALVEEHLDRIREYLGKWGAKDTLEAYAFCV